MHAMWYLIPCGLAALVAVPLALITAARSVRRFGERRDLPPLTPSAFATVVRHERSGTVWAAGAIAICFAAIVVVALHVDASGFEQWALLLALYPAVTVAGAVHSALHQTFRPASGGPRVAPARTLRVDNVVPAAYAVFPERLLWGLLAVVIAASVAVVLATDLAGIGAIGAILAVVAAALVGFRLLERAVVARPQPLQNGGELAWDQALRTQTLFLLRQVQAATVVAGIGGVVAVPLAGIVGANSTQVCLAFTAAAVNFVMAAYAMRIDQYSPTPAPEGAPSA